MEKKHSVSYSKLEKRIGTVAKSAEEKSEVQDRKEEADGIIFASMTNKLDQVDLTLQTIQHQQVTLVSYYTQDLNYLYLDEASTKN